MLRGMSGRGDGLHHAAVDRHPLARVQWMMQIPYGAARWGKDARSRGMREFERTRYEVRVEVRFEDSFDTKVACGGGFDVALDAAVRVDHTRRPVPEINNIGAAAQAFVNERCHVHLFTPSCRVAAATTPEAAVNAATA